MSEEQPEIRVIRIRVETSGDEVYLGAIIMSRDGTQVKEHHTLAGDYGEIRSFSPDGPVKDFIAFKETILFNEKADKSRTQDFDRLLARITRNIDFVDKLRRMIKGKDRNRTEYDIRMEIEGSLGLKQPTVTVDLQPMELAAQEEEEAGDAADPATPTLEGEAENADAAPPTGPDLSQHVQLTFIISPSTGTPLGQLAADMQILARFADPEEELTSNYMIEQGLKSAPLPEEDGADGGPAPLPADELLPDAAKPKQVNEVEATIAAIEELPENQTLLYLKIPGDRDAYIIEEEKSVKVKLAPGQEAVQAPADDAATAAPAAESAAGPGKGGGETLPLPLPALAVLGGVVVLFILLLVLLA